MAKRVEGKIAVVVGAGQTPGETIGNGRKGTIMPAWKGKLSDEEIAAVAGYVRSLGHK